MDPDARKPSARSGRGTHVALALLLLALGGVLLFRLGATPIGDHPEARTWEVTRGMLESGDWLVPRAAGEARLVKPPLYYWSACVASVASGGAGRFVWRLPSALAALALAGLTFAWGRSLGGDRLGLAAACCLVMMPLVLAEGRRGVAEMELALFSNLALFTFDGLFFRGMSGRLPLFALWLALALLAKATTALLLIGLPIALASLLQRRLRGMLRAPVLAWVALGVLAGASWHAVILATVPGAWDTFRMAATLPLGVRTPGVEATATHYLPAWFYVSGLARAALPALLLLPWAAWRALGSRAFADDPRRRLLVVVVASLWLAFSLIPQKQEHYLLPLLPALAILLADAALARLRETPAAGRRMLKGFGVAGAVVGMAALGALLWFYAEVLGTGIALLAAAGAVGLALVAGVLHAGLAGRPLRLLGLCTCGSLLLALVYFGSLDLWNEQFRAGTAQQRSDYDAGRWSRAWQLHPFLRAAFPPGEG